MRNLRNYVSWTVVTTAILVLTAGAAYSDDQEVPGKPFEYLQQQIDNLQQQVDNLQQRIDSIPGSAPPRFTDEGDGTIFDNDTGLIWLKDASCSSFRRVSWDDAKIAAGALEDGVCGLTDGSVPEDWRLPTHEEWLEFMSEIYENPALENRAGDAKWYDGDAFLGVAFGPQVKYWSSTLHPSSSEWYTYGWTAQLSDGSVGGTRDSALLYVWPVRN